MSSELRLSSEQTALIVASVEQLYDKHGRKDLLYASNGVKKTVWLSYHHAVPYNLFLQLNFYLENRHLVEGSCCLSMSDGFNVSGAVWRDLATDEDRKLGNIRGRFDVFIVQID